MKIIAQGAGNGAMLKQSCYILSEFSHCYPKVHCDKLHNEISGATTKNTTKFQK